MATLRNKIYIRNWVIKVKLYDGVKMIFASNYSWTDGDYITSVLYKLVVPIVASIFGIWLILAILICYKKANRQKHSFFLNLSLFGAISLLVSSRTFPFINIITNVGTRIDQLLVYKEGMAGILLKTSNTLNFIKSNPYNTCTPANIIVCDLTDGRKAIDETITLVIPLITKAATEIQTILTADTRSLMDSITSYSQIYFYIYTSLFYIAMALALYIYIYRETHKVKPTEKEETLADRANFLDRNPRRQNCIGLQLSFIALILAFIAITGVVISSDFCSGDIKSNLESFTSNKDIAYYLKCDVNSPSPYPPNFKDILPILNNTFKITDLYLNWCDGRNNAFNAKCSCICNKTTTDQLVALVDDPGGMLDLFQCSGPSLRINQLIDEVCEINSQLIAGMFLLISLSSHLLFLFFPRIIGK